MRVGEAESVGGPGTVREVAAGVLHDWWNAGEDEARVVVELRGDPVVLVRFEKMLVTLFGLAHDGRVNAKGMPGPLQAAAIVNEFSDVIRFAKPPSAVQRIAFGILAPVARLAGRRARYAHHRALVVRRDG